MMSQIQSLTSLVGGIFDGSDEIDAKKIVRFVYGDLLKTMGLPKELHLQLLQDTAIALNELIHDYSTENGIVVGVELLDNGNTSGTKNTPTP